MKDVRIIYLVHDYDIAMKMLDSLSEDERNSVAGYAFKGESERNGVLNMIKTATDAYFKPTILKNIKDI